MIGYRPEDVPSILRLGIPDLAGRYVTAGREIVNNIKDAYKVCLYRYVADSLAGLNRRGVGMAIASSRSRASLQEYCAEMHIGGCFRMLVGGGEVENGKTGAGSFPAP